MGEYITLPMLFILIRTHETTVEYSVRTVRAATFDLPHFPSESMYIWRVLVGAIKDLIRAKQYIFRTGFSACNCYDVQGGH
ncbi:hypothetical protein [Membranihabitans maritimus]|uniref:hypothetical protein n=1 Tax=Membranihabitans maritimus TaxID=2904244 RepID=UPI001F3F18E1|nr:hypothetical protein [Membranihabitans maritimus]